MKIKMNGFLKLENMQKIFIIIIIDQLTYMTE